MEQEVQTQAMDADQQPTQEVMAETHSDESLVDQSEHVSQDEGQADQVATDGETKDTGAAFAAVKKNARTKGYRTGYSEGYERARQELLQSQSQIGESNNFTPDQAQAHNQPLNSPAYDPQVMAFQQRQQQIGQTGLNKYKDKWFNSIQDLDQEVRFNPDLGKAVLMAHDLPNSEDIIYKLATDEKFRDDLLDKNERNWGKEMLKAALPSEPQKPQKVVKVANDPVPPLKTPLTNGGGHKTTSDKVKLKKLRILGKA